MNCEIARHPPIDDGGDCCPCARIHGGCCIQVIEQGTGLAVMKWLFMACTALLARAVLQSSIDS